MGFKGINSNFIVDGLLFLFGPFFLWIGGALVLGRIGLCGTQNLYHIVRLDPGTD